MCVMCKHLQSDSNNYGAWNKQCCDISSVAFTCRTLFSPVLHCRSLIQLVVTLGELHTVIRTPRTPAGPPASVPVEDIAGAAGVGMDGDKGERRAKIRELVDEVRRVPNIGVA